MTEKPQPDGGERGRKVFSRAPTGGRKPVRPPRRAPALVPLVIGFVLLLALVFALGTSATKQLDEVSGEVLDLQRRRGDQSSFLLGLRTALVRLDDEARARARTEARDRFVPPLAQQLRSARSEALAAGRRLRDFPLVAPEEREAFVRDLEAFAEVTESSERYNLEGFDRFRSLEERADRYIAEADKSQLAVAERTSELQREARHQIRAAMFFALAAGLAVAAGTIWEVRRRFRQLDLSLEETRREREFNSQILEGVPTAIANFDAGERLRGANKEFLRIFPRAEAGAVVDAEPEAARVLRGILAETPTGATYRGRWRLKTEGAGAHGGSAGEKADGGHGEARTFDAYVAPVTLDDGKGTIVTLVDVTEASAAEERLRRQASLAAVGQAAAQVAHEIKNPLNSIRLGVLHLRDIAPADEETRRTIDLVERGIAHLNKLTVDVTQFARERELELAEADLAELLDESLELVRDRIAEKNIRIERRYPAEPLRASVDADRLRQVFVNLIANAIDASSDAGRITLAVERRADKARVLVIDAGSGMTEETRARLFEAFFTTKKRGTGLGLAVSKKIVEQHGGRIEVRSAPDEGTEFTIELPLQPSGTSGDEPGAANRASA